MSGPAGQSSSLGLFLPALLLISALPAFAQPTPPFSPPFPPPSGVPNAQSQLLTRPLTQRPVRNATGSQCDTDASPCSAPTPVYITISTNKMDPVQVMEGAYYCDAYINIAWRDDRFLAFSGSSSFPWDPSWWMPGPELMNLVSANSDIVFSSNAGWTFSSQQGVFDWIDLPEASAEPAGAVWVMGVVRFAATLAVRVDLHDFPFDSQTSEVQIESSNYDITQLVWRPGGGINDGIIVSGPGVTWKNAIDGWTVKGVGASATDHTYRATGQTFSRLAIVVRLERQSMFWTTRIVLGMVLYTLMSIFALASSASFDAIARYGVVGGFFMGMVGWQYVLVSLTPALGYNTRLDTFVYMDFLVCFLIYSYLCFMGAYHRTIMYATGHLTPEYDGPKEEGAEVDGGGGRGGGGSGSDDGGASEIAVAALEPGSAVEDQNGIHGATAVRSAAGTRETAPPASAKSADTQPSWHRGRVSTFADTFYHKQRKGPCWGYKLCWSGSWAKLPVHRKIDIIFALVVLVVYISATCVILLWGLPSLSACQQGVSCA